MIDLRQLNPQQRAAVEQTEGPLLVLAGAGSGKTRVLTYRVAHLMEKGVAPWHILAITFTNKAAREMADRVHALAGEASEDAWISTFHSCCARILRRDIEKLGYKRQFAIYDEDDRMTVIRSVAKELNLSDKEYPPKQIKAVISDAKNRMLTPTEWLKESGGDFRSKKLYEAYRGYEQQVRALLIAKRDLAPDSAKQIDTIAYAAYGIIRQMRSDPADRPGGERFLKRYLKATADMVKERKRLEDASATNRSEALNTALARSDEVLEHLAQAFRDEDQYLMTNDTVNFTAELNALDTFMKMRGH